MDNKKQQAQRLYMEGKSQKEVADTIGVSERTVYTWVHQYAWNKLRLASYQAPATIADNLCSQIIELQNAIAAREPGKRYPTGEEAEITRKLITSLEKMKKYPSISQSMQVLETFRNYIRAIDKDFARNLGNYTERFLNGKSINGFAPYQVEYCVDPVSPIAAFYDEDEAEETGSKPEVPCPDINTCLHEGNCTYPHCQHPERYAPRPDPTSLYAVPAINYEHATVSPVILSSPKNELQPVINGSIPANPIIVNEQFVAHKQAEDDTMLLAGQFPSRFWEGTLDEANAESSRGGKTAQEESVVMNCHSELSRTADDGSIPATSQPKNVKNLRIASPQTSRNSSHRHHSHR